MSRFAGMVLAGGRSSRMGYPKAGLRWGSVTLVEHVSSILAAALDGPIVVVSAPGQELPRLDGVEVVEDARKGRGPLQGITAGIHAVGARAEAVYVSATDVPFLRPAFVTAVASLLDDADAAVPKVAGRIHPLAAAYRVSVLPVVDRLLAEDRRRATDLLDEITVRWVTEAELRAVDPALESLENLNTPAEYEAARRR
jgi:molybdopterin-guanine dinucleotide biosynthesis protein A